MAISPDQSADFLDGVLLQAIKQDRAWICRPLSGTSFQRGDVNEFDAAISLNCKVFAQVCFVHRRNGVPAHSRVPVNAMDLPCRGRKQMSEQYVPLQMGRRHGDGNPWIAE